jgi:hypothetical protein
MFAPSVRKHTIPPANIGFLHLDNCSPNSHSHPVAVSHIPQIRVLFLSGFQFCVKRLPARPSQRNAFFSYPSYRDFVFMVRPTANGLQKIIFNA